ncbi:MAG TPA: TIGR01777 family oxidoreductase [Povalibacter sp.]|nr:TIGR01777 family oxidoreductase [Povalibacter sp.]
MTAMLAIGGLLVLWLAIAVISAMRSVRPLRWQRNPIRQGEKTHPRTILVSGATGFIGQHLCRHIIESGDRLLVLTRDHTRAWDLYGPHARIHSSLEEIADSYRIDAVVNLAGAPIFAQRWSAARRRTLLQSRLTVTGALTDLIARLHVKPAVLVSASAVGYYGVRGDEELTEVDRGQTLFQSQLCQMWELAAQQAENHGVRVCRLRLGIVLGRDGGALSRLALSARMRMCTVLGSGRQWLSWIHVQDVVRLIDHCIERDDLRGAVNATAPAPVTQQEFAEKLSARFGRSIHVRVPQRVLRSMLGEMAQLLVDGQRVVPLKARCAGFEFRYGTLEPALLDLIQPTARAPVEILYDTLCPICDAEMRSYRKAARRAGIRWRFADVATRSDLIGRYGLDVATARKRVYVLDDAGTMVSGMDAFALIWTRLPRWQLLGRAISLPGVRGVAAGFYDFVLAPIIWNWNRRRRAAAVQCALPARSSHADESGSVRRVAGDR